MMVKITLPLFDMKFVSFLTGKDMTIAAANVPIREVVSATSNVLTLSHTPVSGTLKLYAKSNSRDVGTEQAAVESGPSANQYTIATATVTLGGTVADTTEYVAYYDYAAPSTTKTMTFTADNFAGYMRLTGEGIVTDQYTGTEEVIKFDFKKCKPQGSFTITQSSTAATQLDITFDMYSVDVGSDKVYCTMHEMVT